MPNWCENTLKVEHSNPEMISRVVDAFNQDRLCEEFVPKPADIGDGWWDWCVTNWGTKWDVGCDGSPVSGPETPNSFECSFQSAWAPPVGLYKALHAAGFKVDATYFEPGMAFCGTWVDGNDVCIEYQSKEDIPEGIRLTYSTDSYFED